MNVMNWSIVNLVSLFVIFYIYIYVYYIKYYFFKECFFFFCYMVKIWKSFKIVKIFLCECMCRVYVLNIDW